MDLPKSTTRSETTTEEKLPKSTTNESQVQLNLDDTQLALCNLRVPNEIKGDEPKSELKAPDMPNKMGDSTTGSTQHWHEKDLRRSQNLQIPLEDFHNCSVYSSEGGSIRYEFDLTDTVPPEQETSYSNAYSTKKTVVQGMMDLALITANANQLRTQLEYGSRSATFELVVFCIVLSLCIQITVGLTLIVFRHKMHPPLDYKERPRYIKRIDNLVLAGVFLVTVLNVFIAAFTTIQDHHIAPYKDIG